MPIGVVLRRPYRGSLPTGGFAAPGGGFQAAETSGWTDAADHYGAAVGAIVTGAILFPLFGAERSCVVLAMLLITPAILISCEMLFGLTDQILAKYRL